MTSLLLILLQLQQQRRPFNGLWSGTTRVGRYQKELSPTHTYPNQRASFIIFLHLQRSMASSLFSDDITQNINYHRIFKRTFFSDFLFVYAVQVLKALFYANFRKLGWKVE